MKLQSTTTKNQAKAIDLEIKRLDAAQARELLSIVQVWFYFASPTFIPYLLTLLC